MTARKITRSTTVKSLGEPTAPEPFASGPGAAGDLSRPGFESVVSPRRAANRSNGRLSAGTSKIAALARSTLVNCSAISAEALRKPILYP
jgi:hypothetical protein